MAHDTVPTRLPYTLARLQELLDREAIRELTSLYCRAVDRLDTELLRSLYHPDGIDQHGLFNGTVDEYAEYLTQFAQTMSYSMHNLTSQTIEIHGEVAAGETYYLGYHVFNGGWEPVAAFFGPTYARARQTDATLGEPQAYICSGRYIDRFEKRAGLWKIKHRQITNEWNICMPARHLKEEGILLKLDLPGRRDNQDPAYLRFAEVRRSSSRAL
jgi:hypothetical protein